MQPILTPEGEAEHPQNHPRGSIVEIIAASLCEDRKERQ